MGNAQANLVNNTPFPICIVTFNYVDVVFVEYNNFYSIAPGASQLVEAITNPFGLKVGVVYDVDAEGRFHYKLWSISNGGLMSVESIEGGGRVATIGSDHDECGSNLIKYSYWSDFLEVLEGLRRANLDVPDLATMQDIPPARNQQRRRTGQGGGLPQEQLGDLTSIIRAQRQNLRPSSVFEPTLTSRTASGEGPAGAEIAAEEPEIEDSHDDNSGDGYQQRRSLSFVPASLPAHSVHMRVPARRSSDGSPASLVRIGAGSRNAKRMVGPRRSVPKPSTPPSSSSSSSAAAAAAATTTTTTTTAESSPLQQAPPSSQSSSPELD